MTRAQRSALALAAFWLHLAAGSALAQPPGPFLLRCDGSGVRSLKRTNDLHDTEYLAEGAALGRLRVRYRGTPNGTWRELRDLVPRRAAGPGCSPEFALGAPPPALATKASPSAERGVGGLRALSDGIVPDPRGAAGAATVPVFTWTAGANGPGGGGSSGPGPTRWVQYTFAVAETISHT